MSNSGYRDGPNQIKYEAQQISLNFVKDTPNTATLSWNIPSPVFGCDENSRAYNGVVVTVSTTSVTQAQKPQNGIVYTGDATVSASLHAGDKIGDALVVGTFYDDDITTTMTVADLEGLTPYYFSVYAVSQQLIYDPAGAHAYSLPIGKENEYKDFPGYQEVRVLGMANKRVNVRNFKELATGSMLGQAATNLNPTAEYVVTICSDLLGENLQLPITGIYAVTWDDLVKELNRQIALSQNPIMSGTPPNTGSLYLDVLNGRLFQWLGTAYDQKELIVSLTDPNTPTIGNWWFDTDLNKLMEYTIDGWTDRTFVSFSKPFSNIVAGDVWVNPGQFAAKWEGATWCKRALYEGIIDPSLAVALPGGTFWFNPDTGFMSEWDPIKKCWTHIQIIYSAEDPSNLLPGQLWYDYTANMLYRLTDTYTWAPVLARVSEIAAKSPADGDYWINPKTDEVKQYEFATKTWKNVDCIQWDRDPLDRKSCDKWWNSTTDKLYIWDFLTSAWVEVVNFVQPTVDPSLAPVLPNESIWNGPAGTFIWDGMQWVAQEAVILNHDPRAPITGEITKIGSKFWSFNGTAWTELSVLQVAGEPTIALGTYWYLPATMILYVLTVSGWVGASYVTRPQVPDTGSQYFDLNTQTMLEWKNGQYVVAELPAHFLINELNNLMAVSKTKGSTSFVKLGFDMNFKTDIKPNFFGFESVIGTDGISPTPSYKTEGVGTDGSVDERREIANYILSQLGYPKIQVELTKRHVDEAIDDALETLRMRTSAAYTRSYMAMDIYPDVQVYEFSNKTTGANRVVRVLKVLRTRYGRIGAYSYEDTFGSAMIQQLYYAGSFDLLSYHLLSSYNELINMVFANDVTFNWNEYSRTLHIQQVLRNKERCLVEVELEKTEQELLVDRNLRSWLKKYTLGKCLLTLARIRGKFGSLPGAGGGIALNGQDLQTEGNSLIEECIADIDNMIISGLDQYGSSSMVIMG